MDIVWGYSPGAPRRNFGEGLDQADLLYTGRGWGGDAAMAIPRDIAARLGTFLAAAVISVAPFLVAAWLSYALLPVFVPAGGTPPLVIHGDGSCASRSD